MAEEKITALAKIFNENPEKVEYFCSLKPAEAVEVFANYGCEFTEAEIKALATVLNTFIKDNTELDEGSLDNVAGGAFKDVLGGMFVGCLIAAGVAVSVPW